jgi:hypothetical protein
MQAAVAAEQTSPLGVAALRRVAVTAPDVTTQDDALRVVRQRRPRRLIERSHDVLNSGGWAALILPKDENPEKP